MKQFFSLLLLLTTTFYVLPVKYSAVSKETATEQNTPDKTEDCKELKKDTGKEFTTHLFSFSLFYSPVIKIAFQQFHFVPLIHHTVETPPPNYI